MAMRIEPMGEHGIRLLKQWERGPDDGSVRLSPGGAALDPYLCDGDKVTLGWGCTEWFDGSPVTMAHTLSDEADAEVLLEYNVLRFLRLVDRLVTRDISTNQRDALGCLAFNLGPGNFSVANCSALRLTNEGRFEDAAEAFCRWTGATNSRPSKLQLREAALYGDKIGRDTKGRLCWVGPTGEPCGYMHRYVGLLNRHASEGCLYRGYDWVEATRKGIFLDTKPPSEAIWNEKRNRWEEQTRDQTRFKQIERVAEAYPLPEPEDDFMFEANDGAVPQGDDVHEDPVRTSPDADAGEDMPPASVPLVREPPSSAPAPAAAPDTPAPVPAVVAPVGTKPIHPASKTASEVPYGIDPNAPLKPMEFTERFVGAAWMYIATWLKTGSKNVAMFTGPAGLALVAFMEFINTPAGLAAMGALTVMIICGIFYAFGWRLDKNGLRKKKRGEVTGTQGMY